MDNNLESLAQVIQQLAATTPAESVSQLASELSAVGTGAGAQARNRIAAILPNAGLRRRVENLINMWQRCAPQMDGTAVALALVTAFESVKAHRATQSVDLVWTGPDSAVIPLRRTDQALLQIINRATTKLLIVSFAVYKIPSIVAALVQATQRGVALSICVESPVVSEGKLAYDPRRAFGDLQDQARFYGWSLDQRPCSPDGKHGSLHSKAAVTDSTSLLISSANLTEYALNLNMELGVLIQGGELPRQVEQHFEQLIAQGTLVPLLLRDNQRYEAGD